jgi:hypothetical protein
MGARQHREREPDSARCLTVSRTMEAGMMGVRALEEKQRRDSQHGQSIPWPYTSESN